MDPAPFVIGIPVYDGVDLLDVSAPREVFGWMGESAPPGRTFVVRVLGVD